jgi:hypothetical protein
MKQNFTVRRGALEGLEAFLAVAQHRSFSRAAAELGVTPSAISQAIRALEAHVGAALFSRCNQFLERGLGARMEPLACFSQADAPRRAREQGRGPSCRSCWSR